jgi:hypothetical protein
MSIGLHTFAELFLAVRGVAEGDVRDRLSSGDSEKQRGGGDYLLGIMRAFSYWLKTALAPSWAGVPASNCSLR